MLCKSCGAKVKEGTETCPSCGAELLRATDPDATPEDLAAEQADSGDCKKAIDPINKLYRLNVYYLFAMCAAMLAGVFLVFQTGRYLNNSLSETGLEDNELIIGWIVIFLAVVEFGLMAKIVYELHRLSDIRVYFRRAVYFGIAMVTLMGVQLFTDHAVVNIATLILGVLFYKFYCDGMSKLCLPKFQAAHDRWTLYWKIYFLMVLLTFGTTFLFEIRMVGIETAIENPYPGLMTQIDDLGASYLESVSEYLKWSYGFLVLTFIFSAIAVMYELKALKATGEAFKKA